MKVYIHSTSAISPQPTFGKQFSLQMLKEYSSTRLLCIEPDYKNYIDSKLLRRMSRVVRMGVTAALDCLSEAGIEQPDAIITGTAYGCLEDTALFLTRMTENKEAFLSPTAFIQSTHNTIGSQIALQIKCHHYNNSFVHRGLSFESTLYDAVSLLEENDAETVLVGGIDESTTESYTILSRFGMYRKKECENTNLFSTIDKGTLSGEGAVFFLLRKNPSSKSCVCLEKFATFIKPLNFAEVELKLADFLRSQSLLVKDIDLVILGRNGNSKDDEIYSYLEHSILKEVRTCNYKHLCGEYPTSSSFALWLGTTTLITGQVPFHDELLFDGQSLKRVLIYNHDQSDNHSIFLLSAC